MKWVVFWLRSGPIWSQSSFWSITLNSWVFSFSFSRKKKCSKNSKKCKPESFEKKTGNFKHMNYPLSAILPLFKVSLIDVSYLIPLRIIKLLLFRLLKKLTEYLCSRWLFEVLGKKFQGDFFISFKGYWVLKLRFEKIFHLLSLFYFLFVIHFLKTKYVDQDNPGGLTTINGKCLSYNFQYGKLELKNFYLVAKEKKKSKFHENFFRQFLVGISCSC